MMPPKCPITGRHIRWLLLLAVLSYFVYFLVHGLQEPPSSRVIYICDTHNESEMKQCNSLDDVDTCAGLKNTGGDDASCIQSSCGYRLFDHIDVSIAGSSDPYDSNAATVTTSFISVVSMIYGLMPYLMGFIYLILFLASGNLVPFTRLVVLGVISIVNEGLFKHWISQKRPLGSCLYFGSYGMPSGHAATSIGLLTYVLLELFVLHPNLLCGLTCQKGEQRNAYSYQVGYGWQTQAVGEGVPGDSVAIDVDGERDVNGSVEESKESSYPLLDENGDRAQSSTLRASSTWLYHLCALGWFVLLFPVPFSRVYLHDHLRTQVLAGSFIGIVASTIWYLGFMRNCGMRVINWRTSEWGKWWGMKFGWEEGFF